MRRILGLVFFPLVMAAARALPAAAQAERAGEVTAVGGWPTLRCSKGGEFGERKAAGGRKMKRGRWIVLLVGVCALATVSGMLLAAQYSPPAGVKFEVVSVRVLSDKESADRVPDVISRYPLVAVRLRLSVGPTGVYLYSSSRWIAPLGYNVKWVNDKLVWLHGKPGENEHSTSPGIKKAAEGIPAVWLGLSGHLRPAIEWEELDSTAYAGEKHAFTVFIKERENDEPKEIISEPFLVPASRVAAPPEDEPESDEREALLAADRAFDQATAEKGIDGWVAFFAPNGSMLPGDDPPVTGPEAIRQFMGPTLAQPNSSLRWQPTRAEILIPGVLGMTTGRFERRWVDAEGKPQRRKGTYVTIWKKQPDGSWKVVFDTGTPDPPETKPN